jgi:predicted aspartyl protease
MKHRFRWLWLLSLQPWFWGSAAAWILVSGGLSWGQTLPRAAANSLLIQVQQCIRQKLAQPNTIFTQEISTRCVLSVVMLNPDGTVRPDASARMTALLQATGTAIPKPMAQGQANVTLQKQPTQAIFSLRVRINNQMLSFVVDSGASNTMVDTQVAQRLGLKGQAIPSDLLGSLAIGQQFGKQKMALYQLPSIAVGQAQVSRLTGIGLSTNILPFKTSGVLGLDFLSRFDMILNPQSLNLQLVSPTRPVATGVMLEGRLGVMTIPQVYVNGKGPYRFLVDTGASVTTLSESLAQRLLLKTYSDKGFYVAGWGGLTQAKRALLEQLRFQTQQISGLNILVVSSPFFQSLGVDGVIGQDILNRYVQHWRFGPPGSLGASEVGSLSLTPIEARLK